MNTKQDKQACEQLISNEELSSIFKWTGLSDVELSKITGFDKNKIKRLKDGKQKVKSYDDYVVRSKLLPSLLILNSQEIAEALIYLNHADVIVKDLNGCQKALEFGKKTIVVNFDNKEEYLTLSKIISNQIGYPVGVIEYSPKALRKE